MKKAATSASISSFGITVALTLALLLLSALAWVLGTQIVTPSNFILEAETRHFSFTTADRGTTRWALPATTVLMLNSTEPPRDLPPGLLELGPGADVSVTQVAARRMQIEVRPVEGASFARPYVRLNYDGLPADLATPEGGVNLAFDIPQEEMALAAQGSFKVGGLLPEGSRALPPVLLHGKLFGRSSPVFGSEILTFLETNIEEGSRILSHPELQIEGAQQGDGLIARWISRISEAPSEQAAATIRLGEREIPAMSIVLWRRANAIGMEPQVALAAEAPPPVSMTVPIWPKIIQSPGLQAIFLIIIAAGTLVGLFSNWKDLWR